MADYEDRIISDEVRRKMNEAVDKALAEGIEVETKYYTGSDLDYMKELARLNDAGVITGPFEDFGRGVNVPRTPTLFNLFAMQEELAHNRLLEEPYPPRIKRPKMVMKDGTPLASLRLRHKQGEYDEEQRAKDEALKKTGGLLPESKRTEELTRRSYAIRFMNAIDEYVKKTGDLETKKALLEQYPELKNIEPIQHPEGEEPYEAGGEVMAERPRGFDVNQPGSTRESLIGLAQGATTDLLGGVVDAGDAVGSLAAKIPYTPFLLGLSQLKGSSDTLGSEALGSRIYGKAPTEELQRIRDDARLVGGIAGIGELATAKLANLTAKGIGDFLPYLKGVDEVAVTPEGVPIPVKDLPDTSVTKMIAGRNSTSGRSRENMAKEQRKMGKSEEEIYRSTGAYFDSDVLGMDVDAFRHEIPNAEKSTLKIGKIDSTKSSYSSKGGDYFYSKDRVSFGFKPDVSEYQYNPETEALFYNPMPKGAKFEDGSQDLGWNPKLGDILDYPELFEEYPQLRDIMVVRLSSPSVKVGGDTKQFGGFYLHNGPRGKPVIALADAQTVLPEQDFQSRLLHEVQHAIQAIEATPGGGEFIRIYEGLKDRLGVEGDSDYVMGRAIDLYEALYGEVEARIVQQRFLNPELKKESPVQTRKKEAEDTDIIIDEDDAVDVGEEAIRGELEYGDVGYEEVYPEQFKKDGGMVSLLDMAQNMNRGPKGVASLSSIARNMNRPMVS